MIGKFVDVGNKVELQSVGRALGLNVDAEQKTYQSTVHEIISDDVLEITMPLEKSKLVLLPVDSEFNLVFYGPNGPYQCFARVTDRYKSENIYVLVVELTSNLRKYQRREYYRFSCALDMCSRSLEPEELDAIEKKEAFQLEEGLPLRRSVIVDISGGGLRFVCSQPYEQGTFLYCNYHLIKDGARKLYEVIGKVLAVRELEQRPGTYEHRVQYYNIDEKTREEIIRFIFEEERRERQMNHKLQN